MLCSILIYADRACLQHGAMPASEALSQTSARPEQKGKATCLHGRTQRTPLTALQRPLTLSMNLIELGTRLMVIAYESSSWNAAFNSCPPSDMIRGSVFLEVLSPANRRQARASESTGFGSFNPASCLLRPTQQPNTYNTQNKSGEELGHCLSMDLRFMKEPAWAT